MIENLYIEPYANGFIVVDYSGNRGKFGAAYCGTDGEWRDQPIGMTPFLAESDANTFIKGLQDDSK